MGVTWGLPLRRGRRWGHQEGRRRVHRWRAGRGSASCAARACFSGECGEGGALLRGGVIALQSDIRTELQLQPRTLKLGRFCRRTLANPSLLEAPRNALEYVWISLPTSVEDILPPTRWASPIGMALFLLHWILLAPVLKPKDELSMWRDGPGPDSNRVDARWHRYEDEWRKQQARRGILGTSSVSFDVVCIS